jgi:hypothetical protein
VRTAFHDAVARFGGFGTASDERFLLVEQQMFAAPPLTPLSRCNRRKPFDKKRARSNHSAKTDSPHAA